MRVTVILIALVIYFTACGATTQTLEPGFDLTWNVNGNTISFTVTANHAAWVGVGFHPVGSQQTGVAHADMVIATTDSSGSTRVSDYYAVRASSIKLDTSLGGQNNLLLATGSQANGVTTFQFSRNLDAQDPYDVSITNGSMGVVWAYGKGNTLSCRCDYTTGSTSINFFEGQGSVTPCIMLENASVPPNFCATQFTANVNSPRQIITAPNGDLLVVSTSDSKIYALWDSTGDGISSSTEQATLVSLTSDQLSHALVVHSGYLYASSSTTVYRWAYSGQRSDLGAAQTVIINIPCCHHVTRPVIFDAQGLLYVDAGSSSNVDLNSTHARIHRFTLPATIPSGGIDWDNGELFADGLRNEVGLAFDNQGRLWGVENGRDDLNRPDLGGDIHSDNPGEEVNLFAQPGKFYGYPYCFSEYNLPTYGKGPTTQWADPGFVNDGTHTDAWCQNTSNVVKPAYVMAAHQAPLGITFNYESTWPSNYGNGGAFVSVHGSWNRQPPQGFRVIFLTFQNGLPVAETPFLYYNAPPNTSQEWPNGVRPVASTFASCCSGCSTRCLYVTSDNSNQIIKISYKFPDPPSALNAKLHK